MEQKLKELKTKPQGDKSKLDCSIYPFDKGEVSEYLDLDVHGYLEISNKDRWIYDLLLDYIHKNKESGSDSHKIAKFKSRDGDPSGCGGCCGDTSCGGDSSEEKTCNTKMYLGYGFFSFKYKEQTLYALHQLVGDVVGTRCGPEIMKSLVLFTPIDNKDAKILQALCEDLINKAEATKENFYKVFCWETEWSYWNRIGFRPARPLDSVILPPSTKAAILDDLDLFESKETKLFYAKHGIPYRRSFLFHGKPGSGKTSLVSALAGRYRRNVCFLQATHPKMTDDILKQAMLDAPERSIIVFEDIDALFTKTREKKNKESHLTFSGLLNALDGFSSPAGQVIILTTNFREKLDSALVRQGRVDKHVEFTNMTHEQLGLMFLNYYPKDVSLKDEFVQKLETALSQHEDLELSPAALQTYFLKHMRSEAQTVVNNVHEVIQALKTRKEDEKSSVKEEEDENKKEKDCSPKKKAMDFHFHIHN